MRSFSKSLRLRLVVDVVVTGADDEANSFLNCVTSEDEETELFLRS